VKVAMPNDPRPTRSFFVVGIGASAGGLDSFQKLFTHLPTNLEMAFVVVVVLAGGLSQPKEKLLFPPGAWCTLTDVVPAECFEKSILTVNY
jgi:hypothetical protein